MKRPGTPVLTALTLAAATLVTSCSSGSGSASSTAPSATPPASTRTPAASPSYDPKIRPADFSPHVTNPLFPLPPGRKLVYQGTKDGAPEQVDVTVLPGRRTILGVRCVVVSDIVTSNSTLIEKTVDWYAQDSAGNVWYFGEDTAEYTNGVVTSTQGTWEAGVDNAEPGIVMAAGPVKGKTYRQEFRPGVAEDMARIVDVAASVRVPAGVFARALMTRDIDPLTPDKVEHKYYGRGVGLVRAVRLGSQHHETIALTKVTG